MPEQRLIGRERERARLSSFLGLALGGRGGIVFVAGEAGSGKTALVQAFRRELEAQHEDLVVVTANCNAQGGLGDPYLPFREVLGVLTGATEAPEHAPEAGGLKRLLVRSTRVLVEVGPDLIGTLVPGWTLLAKVGKAVLEKAGWIDRLETLVHHRAPGAAPLEQSRVFEQYTNVLRALAEEQPLCLIIDDLHWADEASTALLFHLSRRLDGSPVLIIGTYRPDEVALNRGGERRSLDKVLAEIKRYGGDVCVDLGETPEAERREFVRALVAGEPNRLDAAFQEQLFVHTGGHPLFTGEILRTLQERGDLIRDAQGRWVLGTSLDWDTLPARVEGVIQERVGRLGETEREILNVASVEGSTFTAEVVAEIAGLPMRQLLRELSIHLDKQHRLVQEQGEVQAGDSLLAGYRFAHALFQKYLYGELSQAERRLLHGEVARLLEQFYGEHTGNMVATLAWHYDQAGKPAQAARYLLLAGERARNQGAPVEGRRFFTRALELLPADALEQRWRALAGRETVVRVMGEREAQQADVLALLHLADQLGDDAHRAEASLLQALHAQWVGDYPSMLRAAEDASAAARRASRLPLLARGLAAKTLALTRLGRLEEAGQSAQETHACALTCGDDFACAHALARVALYCETVGDLVGAINANLQAAEIGRRTGEQAAEGQALGGLGNSYMVLGLYDTARAMLEQSLQINTRIGFRQARAYDLRNLGWLHLQAGDHAAAGRLLEQALDEFQAVGETYGRATCLLCLAQLSEVAGDLDRAMAQASEAQAIYSGIGLTGPVTDCLVLLTRCALRLGQAAASAQAATIWRYLHEQEAAGMENVAAAWLVCADVFSAQGDATASRLATEQGYRQLVEAADRISDLHWRSSFLENVPHHRELLGRHRGLHPPPQSA